MRRNLIALAATAAIVVPAAAVAQSRYINQRDVAEAQRQHAELVEEFGGAETGARGTYVSNVGRRVADLSGIVTFTNVS